MVTRTKSGRAVLLAAATCLTAWPSLSLAETPAHDSLVAGFENPPQSARPRVWWHWMNGNVTRTGIEADLRWMSRIGIGGMQNFDVALETPTIVERRLVYMSPEWKDAFKYAATLATGLHLELGIAASPGWSETGGPWVRPADGMKKLVWSETVVDGGTPLATALKAPPAVTGPYQDLAVPPSIFDKPGAAPKGLPAYYADVAVVAVPVTADAVKGKPRYSAAGMALDAAALSDGDLQTSTKASISPGGSAPQYIDVSFDAAQTVRSATIFIKGMGSAFQPEAAVAYLEASPDGVTWSRLTPVSIGTVPSTVSFPATTASHFRLAFEPPVDSGAGSIWTPAPGAVTMNIMGGPPSNGIDVAEFSLSSAAKVNRFEAKAGFVIANDYYGLNDPADEPGVDPAQVIDLTGRLKGDGTLDWTPPPGRWRIIRYGYSLTGTENHPATAEATGLEVDKYDGTAVRNYMNTYLDMYRDAVGPDLMGRRGVQAMVNDSTEIGPSNWTPDFFARFKTLRGYDAHPWLPALSGTIVGSRARSDAFLYDFRRTLADLVVSEHYEVVADVAHQRGLKTYGESLEGGRMTLGDDMEMRRYADVPMSAMWAYKPDKGVTPVYLADMKGASSVAHIYGQNLAAAESLTAAFNPWAYSPADLQPMIDLEFASGINRPVIHTSVHQPTDDKLPGMSLMIFGQYFNRHETWAEMARPWVDYMARNSFMLQQGTNVADIAYFYGEDAPLVALYQQKAVSDAPRHYGFDFIDPQAVTTELFVEDGILKTKGGAAYRALYLGGSSQRMTVPTLQRLDDLVKAGATIIGPAPGGTPSAADDPKVFSALVQQMWGGGAVTSLGKGRVIAGNDIEAALHSEGIASDLELENPDADVSVMFVHRHLKDAEIYFVTNRSANRLRTDARFRTNGLKPEIWRADTGRAAPASYRVEGGQTIVPLDMAARDSFFVVFRKPGKVGGETVSTPAYRKVAQLNGAWRVNFTGLAAPKPQRFDRLQSLSDSSDAQIRYFSGVTTYRQTINLSKRVAASGSLVLDLGAVGDVATVTVNGRELGTAWRAPYTVDIAKAVHPGDNSIEVRVANLWVNRLIGDAQPGATKVTYTAVPTYMPDAPLRPAGLIGPVVLSARVP